MKEPTVTVLLPVYNAGRYLKQAIDSILSQTFPDFELIVINDGSTDDSGAIIGSYRDCRLIRLDNEKNERLVYALNRGLEHARGRYVAIMNADDISSPRRLERQVAYMDAHPGIGLVGSYAIYIDENDVPIGRVCPPTNHNILSWHLFYYCPFINPTTMFRPCVLDQAGRYNSAFENAVEDYDLWARMSAATAMANIPEFLVKYRLWGGTISSTRVEHMRLNNIAVKRYLVARELGRDVKDETVENILKIGIGSTFSSVGEIAELVDLNHELYTAFVQSRPLTRREKREIKTNVSRKLYLLSFKAMRVSVAEGFALFLRVFRLYPAMFPRVPSVPMLVRHYAARKWKLVGPGSLRRRPEDDW